MAGAGGDVAVVGGGLVGAALAYELAGLGAEVVMVDRHDRGRATDAGAGICSPETIMGRDDSWLDLADGARAHYDQLAGTLRQELGRDPGFSLTGLLSMVSAEHEERWLDQLLAAAADRHPGVVVEISPDEAEARFPPLVRPFRVLWNPRAGRIDGSAVTAALTEVAERRGVRRVSGGVTGLQHVDDRVTALETTEGVIPCDTVAIAGGAWSAHFEAVLGVSLPVTPLKGQIAHLVLEGTDSTSWPIVQPLFGFYLVPWPGGRVACGGTMEPEAGFDVRVTAAGARDLLREAVKTAPGLGPATVAEIKVGLRPRAGDDRPIVGRLASWANVFVDTGHGTDGLLLGPYSGRLLAAEIGGTEQPALATFRPERFPQ